MPPGVAVELPHLSSPCASASFSGRTLSFHISKPRDVDGVIREVSARAGSAGIAPQGVVAQSLFEREKLHSTVIGSGLAIPYAAHECVLHRLRRPPAWMYEPGPG